MRSWRAGSCGRSASAPIVSIPCVWSVEDARRIPGLNARTSPENGRSIPPRSSAPRRGARMKAAARDGRGRRLALVDEAQGERSASTPERLFDAARLSSCDTPITRQATAASSVPRGERDSADNGQLREAVMFLRDVGTTFRRRRFSFNRTADRNVNLPCGAKRPVWRSRGVFGHLSHPLRHPGRTRRIGETRPGISGRSAGSAERRAATRSLRGRARQSAEKCRAQRSSPAARAAIVEADRSPHFRAQRDGSVTNHCPA